MSEEYQQQKREFLDSLLPDDFRNAATFNQAEFIIDQLNKSVIGKKNPDEFIKKAITHLFREGSPAVDKAVNLYKTYIETL